MGKNKKKLTKYLIEAIIVSFGVFLAIIASDWRTGQKTEAKVIKTLEFMVAELQNNAKRLNLAIDYHEMIKHNFDSMVHQMSEEDFAVPYYQNETFRHFKIPGWTGVGIPRLEDIVYESGKTANIFQELDIETIHLISKAYSQQDFFADFGNSALNRFLTTNSDTKTIDVIGSLELLTSDILTHEKTLKQHLDSTANQLVITHNLE